MVANIRYFYDKQIRRNLMQITRMFCNFYVTTGTFQNDGKEILRRVPCRMATSDRTVAAIITNNTENFIATMPIMIVTLDGISSNDRMNQSPSTVQYDNPVTRKFDKETGKYTHDEGQGYEVRRMNPKPITMKVSVHIFTTKVTQKLELMEQIMLLFNPGVDIQLTKAAMDWTFMPTLRLSDVQYTSKTFENDSTSYDVATLRFTMDTYINPPAYVKPLRTIRYIISDINTSGDPEIALDFENISRLETTPGNHWFKFVTVDDTTYNIQLLDESKAVYKPGWLEMLKPYGVYEPGKTKLKLRIKNDDRYNSPNFVVGTLTVNEEDETWATWVVDQDTMPSINIPAVTAMINPTKLFPGQYLPEPTAGTRYLIQETELGTNTKAWGKLYDANGIEIDKVEPEDIIEYDGQKWFLSFDASEYVGEETYTIDLKTCQYYEFIKDTGWVFLIDGTWPGHRIGFIMSLADVEYAIDDSDPDYVYSGGNTHDHSDSLPDDEKPDDSSNEEVCNPNQSSDIFNLSFGIDDDAEVISPLKPTCNNI